ncbi:MFS drug transporter, partial [Aspergillus homomorphus CBS 101889]
TTEALEVDETPQARSKLRIASILVALYLVLFISALDQTIVATSIPTICAALHSASGYTWIGGAYLLANAATGPIWTRCSDIWGRKPALLSAVAIFGIASIIAALSTSMRMLIAARALQGTAGGGLIQMVYITISDLFSMRRRALHFGLMGLIWAVAGTTGPLIGGALTQLATWRWCFWLNLPVCGAALTLLTLFLDVHNPRTSLSHGLKAIDWPGTACLLAVSLLLLLGLDLGGASYPWSSARIISLLAAGTFMAAVFLYTQHRLSKYPLLPLHLFQSNRTTLLAPLALGFAHSMVALGTEYYLPLYFQAVQQASPLRSGLLLLPLMLTEAATDILVGVLIHRTGRYREIVWAGAALLTLGTALLTLLDVDTPLARVFGLQVLAALGTACLFQTPMLAVQNSVSPAEAASATATLGFVRNLATALSVVLGGVIFQNGMQARQAGLAALGIQGDVLKALSGEAAAANVGIVRMIRDERQRRAVRDAFAGSLRVMFAFYAGVAGVTVVGAAFVKQRRLATEHTEVKTGVQHLRERGGD